MSPLGWYRWQVVALDVVEEEAKAVVVEAPTLEIAIIGRVVAVEGVVVVVDVAMEVMTTVGMVEEEDTAVVTVVMEEVEVRCNSAMLLGEAKSKGSV